LVFIKGVYFSSMKIITTKHFNILRYDKVTLIFLVIFNGKIVSYES